MTEENLILEPLKAILREIRDLHRETRAGFKDLSDRMTSLETRMVGVEMHILAQHADTARLSAKFDHLQDRVERIERRLELDD